MSYSRSLSTVNKHWSYLAPLLKGPAEFQWIESAAEAPRLAYRIRECLKIAENRPEDLPELAAVAHLYVISVVGGRVVARLDKALARHLEVKPEAPVGKILATAHTFPQVIQAWLDNFPCVRLEFLESGLDRGERAELQRWADNLEPPWEIEWVGAGLVLHPKGVSL